MMTFPIKPLCAIALTLSLLGCEALGLNEYDKRNQESDAVLARIEQSRSDSPAKVERIEQPPVRLSPITRQTETDYLSKTEIGRAHV